MHNKLFKSDSAAWHFYYALVFVVKVSCRSIGMRASHLTRRYASGPKLAYLRI
ncbi:DUF3265 domain-containing protein [Vibrio chagasii]|nr:DUF3265 domain-containing protein [Vibrio chagasii]